MSAGLARPSAVDEALAELSAVETVDQGYAALRTLEVAHAAERLAVSQERRRLEDEASFLVGAVAAAKALVPAAPGEGALVASAEQKVAQAKAALAAHEAEMEASFSEAFAKVTGELVARVDRRLKASRPVVTLRVRVLGGDRRILHLDRPAPDDAVALSRLLSGSIPLRLDALFDDSTDDVRLEPSQLYPRPGVVDLRPGASALGAVVDLPGETTPMKGQLAFWLPDAGQGRALVRLKSRGPVLEVELADGETFRSVLTRAEAERVAGVLLSKKLEGALELELVTGGS